MNFAADTKREITAGLTTFFTMSYIVVVNPSILSTHGTGMSFSGVLTATVLLAFSMTLLMGLYARLPFAVAPGMGMNAFIAYTIILGEKVPWQIALGITFWAGVLFVLVSVTSVRVSIANAIPPNLKIAAGAGIGLFLTFIGLRNAGFIVGDPVTFVKLGPLDIRTVLFLAGFVISVVLLQRKSPFAFLASIFAVTGIAIGFHLVSLPVHYFSVPNFKSVFLKLNFFGALKLSFLPSMAAVMLTDLFDSISTFVGVSTAANLVDEKGEPFHLREGLIVDAFATLTAGLLGTSSGTAYIESASGIEVGGRTGLTSVVTAFCFLPCLFIAPIAGIVPPYATAPVLVLVGALLFRNVANLTLAKLEEIIPVFLTIILIPLTFSITQGILWGFVSYVGLYLLAGRKKEIHSVMWWIALASVGMIILDHFAYR